MKREEILNILKEILKKHINTDNVLLDQFHEEIDLVIDLNVDSLDVVNIVVDIENYFSIEILNEEIKSMRYIKDAITIIQSKLKIVNKI